MKRIYILIIALTIFTGCNKKTTDDSAVYFDKHIAYDKQTKKKFTGTIKTTYQDCDMTFSTIDYKNGVRDGMATWYYQDGQMRQDIMYVNNKANGTFTEYYPNGQLKSSIKYENGKYKGEMIMYDENGTIIKKITH
jgi:antitoxin component YwqK of YwqJK toxin-antitoxin module